MAHLVCIVSSKMTDILIADWKPKVPQHLKCR